MRAPLVSKPEQNEIRRRSLMLSETFVRLCSGDPCETWVHITAPSVA